MTYTVADIARGHDEPIEHAQAIMDYLVVRGWVRMVGIAPSGEWLYEPSPRLAGLIGRN